MEEEPPFMPQRDSRFARERANFWEANKAKYMGKLKAGVGGKVNRKPGSVMF